MRFSDPDSWTIKLRTLFLLNERAFSFISRISHYEIHNFELTICRNSQKS